MVDGRLTRQSRIRQQSVGEKGFASVKREVCIGDIGYADNTALVGAEEEVMIAEKILVQVITDWEEKVNRAKTERLRLSCMPIGNRTTSGKNLRYRTYATLAPYCTRRGRWTKTHSTARHGG
jgi:hypothetical protein